MTNRNEDLNPSSDRVTSSNGVRSRWVFRAGLAAVVAAALIAWLAFGVFGIHTAFIDDTVSEANPFAIETAAEPAPEAAAEVAPADSAGADAETAAEVAAARPSAPDTAEEVAAVESDDTAVADTAVVEPAVAEAESSPAVVESPAAESAPEITQLATGTIIDHDHSGDGTVVVITDGTRRFLRFEEDFDIDNGPDLNVYLVRGVPAEGPAGQFDDDFIDLGDLKGNKGAQNYEIPADVDLDEYNTVVIWCVRFGVAFNAADLV